MTASHNARLEQLKHAHDLGAIDRDTYDAAAGDNQGMVNLGVIIQQGSRPGADREDLRRAFLARMLTQTNQFSLFADDTGNAQIRLSSVYTALLTQRSVRCPAWNRAPSAGAGWLFAVRSTSRR